MKVKHNLPILMAQREIKSISELSREAKIDYRNLYNFANYQHKRFDTDLVLKLCMALKCEIGDLFYLGQEEKGEGK